MVFAFLWGTAFIAGGDLVTAHHVVRPHSIEYTANEKYDVARVDVVTSEGYNIECRKVKEGEKVYIKGYPSINGFQVYAEVEAEVMGYERLPNGRKSIVMNVELQPGFSGSPVFDTDGDVIAIATDSSRGTPRSLASSVCNLK